METFEPHRLLGGGHAQTFAAAYWRRRFLRLPPGIPREFETEPGTRIRGHCHWQFHPQERPTLVLIHGLEGSSESGYMFGLAERAFAAGWNAVRLNQRNCGGTESLTPTLYHSGLSGDYRAVLFELIEQDALSDIFFAGYSMGGNLVFKMAGDLGSTAPSQLRGIAAVCPSMDLAACADAIALPRNFVYERWFVNNLKNRLRRKARLFPGKFDLSGLPRVRTVREFDDLITARYFAFRDASEYYARSSALSVLAEIRVPAMVFIARDDPFVPVASFLTPAITDHPYVTLNASDHGGHCGFISRYDGDRRFWVEMKVMEFFRQLSSATFERASIEEKTSK